MSESETSPDVPVESHDPGTLTLMIQAAGAGDAEAQEELLRVVGSELHRLAAYYMRGEKEDHVLQPTALVNEMFMKLFYGGSQLSVNNRSHFFAVAASQMRRILVDYARSDGAGKRKGIKVEFDEVFHGTGDPDRDIIAVDDGLKELEVYHSECSQVVELRFFGGYTYEEIATITGRNVAQVRRDWEFARSWLYDRLAKI